MLNIYIYINCIQLLCGAAAAVGLACCDCARSTKCNVTSHPSSIAQAHINLHASIIAFILVITRRQRSLLTHKHHTYTYTSMMRAVFLSICINSRPFLCLVDLYICFSIKYMLTVMQHRSSLSLSRLSTSSSRRSLRDECSGCNIGSSNKAKCHLHDEHNIFEWDTF